jgi:hypothetical protein
LEQVWDGGQWVQYQEDPEPDEPLPYPPETDSWTKNDTTIMVSISSFRDFRCPATLYNLFSKADHPDRVFMGVIQQNDDGDPDCLWEYCVMMKNSVGITPIVTNADKKEDIERDCPHFHQVKIMRVSAEEAKGPTYGR